MYLQNLNNKKEWLRGKGKRKGGGMRKKRKSGNQFS